MNQPRQERISRQQAHDLLAKGLHADLRDGSAVRALLERQFESALRHRSAELTALVDELTPLLEAMEARRQQRVTLVRALLGPAGTMAAWIATLPAQDAAALDAAWGELEALVQSCKDASTRNGNLLAEQYTVMQRVLHGEDAVYAPR